MSGNSFTAEQNQAIFADNQTILVSAAAGSGKTTVLVNRIEQLIRGGARLNRMMIVTFTRAAAAEMRGRLYKLLQQAVSGGSPAIAQALDDLPYAKIGTLDSFTMGLLRQNFQRVGIDPMFRTCEAAQESELFDSAWTRAMNRLLKEDSDPDFRYVTQCWEPRLFKEGGRKASSTLLSLTRELYYFLLTLPAPFDWAKEKIGSLTAQTYTESEWYRMIHKILRYRLEELRDETDAQKEILQQFGLENTALWATWESDRCMIDDAFAAYERGERFETVFDLLQFTRLGTLKKAEKTPEREEGAAAYKESRKHCRDLGEDLRKDFVLREADLDRQLPVIAQMLRGLLCLTRATHECLMEDKLRLNLLSFSDMSQLTLELLADETMREAIAGEFGHIFVDECQDISEIQDTIIRRLHDKRNHLFMVGDVKQSIYRFRNAEPGNFLRRMRSYSREPDAAERAIFLQANFRSLYPILEATNRVFRSVMHADVTEMDYIAEDELILPAGKATEDLPPVELIDCGEPVGRKEENIAAQGQILAAEIRRLLQTKKQDGSYFEYRDIAILLAQAKTNASILQRSLEQNGIPVYCEKDEITAQLPEINVFLEVLKVIVNPLQDEPLLAVLKMPPFRLTDSDLADIRLDAESLKKEDRRVMFCEAFLAACEKTGPLAERCRRIRDTLDQWRFKSRCMPLERFLWYLYGETGFYAEVGALPRGEGRRGNLAILSREAAAFEENGGTSLNAFIARMEKLQTGREALTAQTLGEGENLVRIMTIHKSKGLQFKAVFLPVLDEKFDKQGGKELSMNGKLGLCIDPIDPGLRCRYPAVIQKGYILKNDEENRAEKARQLYVAMTRAEERLLLLTWKIHEPVRRQKPGPGRILSASCFEDWVMQAYHTQPDPAIWTYRTPVSADAEEAEQADRTAALQKWWSEAITCDTSEKAAWWDHIYDLPPAIPLKTSVSSIAKQQIDPAEAVDDASEETLEDKAHTEEIRRPLTLSSLPEKPAWLREKKVTGAARGTLFHEVLAQVDLAPLRGSGDAIGVMNAQIEKMVSRGIFTPEEAASLDVMGLAAFFTSELGQRVLASEEVHREWAFVLREKTGTIIQGVIDCAFREEGGWVLCDYKTDRIYDEKAFVERYALQLAFYARALNEITGLPVRERWLYSLTGHKAYRL